MSEDQQSPRHERRKFLQMAAVAAGAGLLAVGSRPPQANAAGALDALLLRSMDYV
jgi:hypothetical protein